MKTYYKIMLVFLMTIPVMAFSQKTYVKSWDISFSGGNNGNFSGNLSSDVVPTINAVDGIMDVSVNKVSSPWSVLIIYMANCWTKTMVWDQTNRYVEFRVKCNTAQTKPMPVNCLNWGNGDGCNPENKTMASPTFVLPDADIWTIVLLKVPASTGGTQNVLDTVYSSMAWGLENGNYSFDYVKLGTCAIPPQPTMDAVKPKLVRADGTVQNVTLTGISIPGRLIDGLTIKAEALSDGIITNVNIIDLGSGPLAVDEATNIATAALQFTPVVGMSGMGDSIIITLKDTIRGTTTKKSFYVALTTGLEDIENKVSVYPTKVADVVNITLPEAVTGEIRVVDILGNTVATQKITSATTANVDLSAAAPGVYVVKISDGKDVISKKIVKE